MSRPAAPPPPPGMKPAEAAKLTALVDAAIDEQRAQLREAVDNGFDVIPRLLRLPVKKLLGV